MPVLDGVIRFRRQVPRLRVRGPVSSSSPKTTPGPTRQLKQAIDNDGVTRLELAPPAAALEPAFGTPGTYRVVADPYTPDGPPAIDLGCHQRWVPERLRGFAASAEQGGVP